MRLPLWVEKLLGTQKPRPKDSSGPTPEDLDKEQAAASRREATDEHFRAVDIEDAPPPPNEP